MERYDRLVQLTLKITGLHVLPEEYVEQYTPWVALVATWYRCREELKCMDMFFSTLHHLKWAVYPIFDEIPPEEALLRGTPHEEDMSTLLNVFEEELCSPGKGLQELMDLECYFRAYVFVDYKDYAQTDPELKSVSHHHRNFLENRFIALTHPFETIKTECCETIQEAFKLIIPSASMWNDTQWCSEKYILSQVDAVFGTHYAQNPSEFDGLVDLAEAVRKGSIDMPITMHELPLTLLQHLWPHNTEDVIKKLYRETYRHARYHERLAKRRKDKKLYYYEFGYADLANTAIQRLAEGLVSSKKISSERLKKQIFNVQTGYLST